MSNDNKNKRLKPEEINEETFRWRTGKDEVPLDEMNLDFKLTAYAHSLKHANNHFAKKNKIDDQLEKLEQKAEEEYNQVKYFMRLCEVLEGNIFDKYNLELPSTVKDVYAMKRLIKDNIITVSNAEEELQEA